MAWGKKRHHDLLNGGGWLGALMLAGPVRCVLGQVKGKGPGLQGFNSRAASLSACGLKQNKGEREASALIICVTNPVRQWLTCGIEELSEGGRKSSLTSQN